MVERWRDWTVLDENDFEVALEAQWPAQRETEPRFWREGRFNHPSQPVVGVCWYETRAYCAWLSSQTGMEVRLPTEVEWEAAARGAEGRQYAYGDAFDRVAANSSETHIRRTTPVGVFPTGSTPEGVADLSGNVFEWTSSLIGEGEGEVETEFAYPYDSVDGREDADAAPNVRRVVRACGWANDQSSARTVLRDYARPDDGRDSDGFRVVVSV